MLNPASCLPTTKTNVTVTLRDGPMTMSDSRPPTLHRTHLKVDTLLPQSQTSRLHSSDLSITQPISLSALLVRRESPAVLPTLPHPQPLTLFRPDERKTNTTTAALHEVEAVARPSTKITTANPFGRSDSTARPFEIPLNKLPQRAFGIGTMRSVACETHVPAESSSTHAGISLRHAILNTTA